MHYAKMESTWNDILIFSFVTQKGIVNVGYALPNKILIIRVEVKSTKPNTFEDLRIRVLEEIKLITEEALENAVSALYTLGLAHCKAVQGGYLEYFL